MRCSPRSPFPRWTSTDRAALLYQLCQPEAGQGVAREARQFALRAPVRSCKRASRVVPSCFRVVVLSHSRAFVLSCFRQSGRPGDCLKTPAECGRHPQVPDPLRMFLIRSTVPSKCRMGVPLCLIVSHESTKARTHTRGARSTNSRARDARLHESTIYGTMVCHAHHRHATSEASTALSVGTTQ